MKKFETIKRETSQWYEVTIDNDLIEDDVSGWGAKKQLSK